MSARRLFGLLSINVVVFLGGLWVIETAFRLAIEGYSDDKTFRATQPAPYRNAPYFSAEFIDESFRQPGGWLPIPGTNAILPHDFAGKYFTVERGLRRTTDVPPTATARIHVYGGSTIYNSEVPDEHTVASHLQRKLVSAGHTHYGVVNYGVTSVSTTQQLERLAVSEIAPGDIVVFYDGVNDVLQGVLYGNPGDTIYGNDRSRPFGHRLLYRISKHSVAARYVLGRANANYRVANLDDRVARTTERFRANVERAQRIATERGARFVHFLQPTLYSLARRTEYEDRLLTFGFVPVQAEEAFLATYPRLAEVIAERVRAGLADYDLTAAFNELDEPVYLDGWHVNHVANEVVAGHIFAVLDRLGALEK